MTTTIDTVTLVEDDENNLENNTSSSKKKLFVHLASWKLEGFNIFILSTIIFSLAATIALIISIFGFDPQVVPHGAVYSSNKICSQMGSDLMKSKSGNAVDATISTILCLTLTRPDSSSIFGCGSVMVHDRDLQTTKLFEFTCSTAKQYNMPNKSDAPLSKTGVSLTIHALYNLYLSHGTLLWSDYVDPILKLTQTGFPADPQVIALAKTMNNFNDSQILKAMVDSEVNGHFQPPNRVMQFFQSLRELKDPVEFYHTHAQLIDAQLEKSGFNWNFTSEYSNYNYTSSDLSPINFAGFKLLTFPPPYVGGTFVISVLNNLNRMFTQKPLDWKKLAKNDPDETAKYINRLAALSRFAQSLASVSGDPKDPKVAVNVEENSKRLQDDSFNDNIISQINDNEVIINASTFGKFDGFPLKVMQENVSLGDGVVMATDSSRLTVLTSLYLGEPFGTRQELSDTGQMLNSALSLFADTADSSVANVISPGRRPLVPAGPIYLHSMTKKCGIRFGVGSSGGFWGLFDAVQVVSKAAFFLGGSSCTNQKATPPAPTLTIVSNSGSAIKRSSLFGNSNSAVNSDCLPADEAIKSPRVHVAMKLEDGQPTQMVQSMESSVPNNLSAALKKLNWDQSIVPSNSWVGRTAITGWNGYNLIAYGDSRDPNENMFAF